MEYENRQPVEGINAPEGNPLKRFFALAISLLVFITLIYFALFFLGGWLAQRVSFATEARLVESMDINFSEFQGFDANDQSAMEIEQALITEMQIPEDMNVTVHYLDSDVFNAFATLGGHVFFSRGLLEQMPHENALAMVMAHEIAHVTERHPIKGFGGSVTSGVALAIVSSYAGSAGGFISSSSVLSGTSLSMKFTDTWQELMSCFVCCKIRKVKKEPAGWRSSRPRTRTMKKES